MQGRGHHRKHRKDHCTSCGYLFDTDSNLNPFSDGITAPRPGDYTVCLRCGAAMQFDDNLRVYAVSDEALRALVEPRQYFEVVLFRLALVQRNSTRGWPPYGVRS